MQSTIEATENGECKTNTWDQRHSPQMHSSEQPALPEKFFSRDIGLCVFCRMASPFTHREYLCSEFDFDDIVNILFCFLAAGLLFLC